MYYTIENAIGTEIVVNNITLICGNVYENKMKAPKDCNYVLAFHKSEAQPGKWIFDGKADLDYTEFFPDDSEPCRLLAWKSDKINIQAKIRPSKDSAKAIADELKRTTFADAHAQLLAGEIDQDQFARIAETLIVS